MKKLLLLMLACIMIIGQLLAQSRTVTGKVSDETGNSVPNASIVIKGSKSGTSSKEDGTFSLSVPENARALVISGVGYDTKEASIRGQNNVEVALNTIGRTLNEVVVVAYGQQQKRALTGSVTSVTAEQIGRQQITSVTQALQGTASGVLVVNTTGQPGESPTIRIRGIGSVNASAAPLIVLDGVPYDGNINSLNPNDIETMNVLKDATATALFGSRAANGVILITTKTGKKGRDAQINAYSSFGVSSRAIKDYEYVTSEEYMKLAWEALKNQQTDLGTVNPALAASNGLIGLLRYNPYNVAKPIDENGNLVAGANLLWNTDWTKEIENNSIQRKNVGVSAGGGSDKIRYFLSGDYLNQDGYIIKSNFQRITSRLNIDADLRNWLTVGLKTSLASSKQNYPDQSGSAFRNAVQFGRIMSSIYPLYQHDDNGALIVDEKGVPVYDFGFANSSRTLNVGRPVASGANAVAIQNLDLFNNDRVLTSLNTYGEIRFTPDLKFRSNFGIDRAILSQTRYQNPLYGDASGVKGRVSKQRNLTTSYTWNNMLSYQKSVSGVHNIGAMASTEAYDYRFESFSAGKTGLPAPGITELTPGSTLENIDSYTDFTRIVSYLGRLTYNYKSRYFIEGTIRRDGSSRFLTDKRWGTFFAVGGSWLISDENFIKNISAINSLKLRASYGEVGNNALTSYFPYLSAYSTGYSDLTNPGVIYGGLGNPNITWEKLGTYDIGIDFSILKSRISGSVDYYDKNTFDLLFGRPFPGSTGVTSVDENIGSVRNSGIEVVLNTKNIVSNNFSWDMSFNFATVKNRITKLPQKTIVSGSYRLEVGKSLNSFYIYEWAGVNPQTGLPQWNQDELDASGNPTGKKIIVNAISNASRYYYGTSIPKITGGFYNTFTYKKLDLSFLVNYALGAKLLDADYIGLMHGFTNVGQQLHKDILARWQKAGDITDVPRLKIGQSDYGNPSTRHLFSGDYARLRNVTLGYNFPASLFNKIGTLKSLRIYIQADNYLTWTKAKRGLDPELAISGSSSGTSNQSSSAFKTISGGLNIGL